MSDEKKIPKKYERWTLARQSDGNRVKARTSKKVRSLQPRQIWSCRSLL